MSSKKSGTNYGRRRVKKALSWSPLSGGRAPAKRPVGYDEEDDLKSRRY